ncbi:hypothetical protein GQX73_g327 [Xylaria multiplex]|uniref:Zn(2)-C6 fungal-type domain-containing protein n=1 Tax=Xylaria multiplex TaxID=323545 RepID=A0A7C8N0P9_9PEZI|nr:hypothetical protein GQX73_g327 [Xylaria multiplex]
MSAHASRLANRDENVTVIAAWTRCATSSVNCSQATYNEYHEQTCTTCDSLESEYKPLPLQKPTKLSMSLEKLPASGFLDFSAVYFQAQPGAVLKAPCGEEKPQCWNCRVHNASCVYEAIASRPAREPEPEPELEPALQLQEPSTFTHAHMELLHHYTVSTALTLSSNAQVREVWQDRVPRLALHTDYVLHALLAVSALHLARLRPSAGHSYWTMGVQLYQTALGQAKTAMEHISEQNSKNREFVAQSLPREEEFDEEEDLLSWVFLFRGTKMLLMPAYEKPLHNGPLAPMFEQGAERVRMLQAHSTADAMFVDDKLLQTILQKLPGGISLPVEYPAGVAQNTTAGETFVIDTIKQGLRDCPGQKYVLLGYSQGATLMLRALDRLNCEALDAISSITLFGNPYRLPGKLSSVNGAGQPGNNATVGLFVKSAIANNQTIPQLSRSLDQSGKVLDYCLEGDGVCAPNPACSCQLPAGHLSYGLVASVHDTAIEHVVSRL